MVNDDMEKQKYLEVIMDLYKKICEEASGGAVFGRTIDITNVPELVVASYFIGKTKATKEYMDYNKRR